jgi:putative tryptophan/tyrosine transport system substrate-binding protein
VRRRDFTIGLFLAAAVRRVRAEERAKQHRIAIVISSGPVTRINDPASRAWQAFWAELHRLGDIEGQNLIVERYTGEGRPAGYADLAREIVSRNPDVIVPISPPIIQAVSAASATIPIVDSGAYTSLGVVPNLARLGGNITGVTVDAGYEIYGKRLQILKEAVPSASKVALLDMRKSWGSADGQQRSEELRKASRLLEISLTDILLQESTPSEYQRVFAEIAKDRPDAIIVSGISELTPYRQLIVERVEKSRLPAMYPWRDYVEAGGLMAYGTEFSELWRRLADDVHQILNGTKPGDIPIYQPTKFEFVINLKAAKTLGLDIPPTLLGRADEVIE